MTKVKQLVNSEVNTLTGLLSMVNAKIEQIALQYPQINNAKGIEKAELTRLIALCEGRFIDDLAEFHASIRQLSLPRIEGKLILKNNGRYVIDNKNYDNELTSGQTIEVFIDNEEHDDHGWAFGRIEHAEKYGGYYFYNKGGAEHHKLKTGMLAAVRV